MFLIWFSVRIVVWAVEFGFCVNGQETFSISQGLRVVSDDFWVVLYLFWLLYKFPFNISGALNTSLKFSKNCLVKNCRNAFASVLDENVNEILKAPRNGRLKLEFGFWLWDFVYLKPGFIVFYVLVFYRTLFFGVRLFLFFLGIVEAASFAAILLPKGCECLLVWVSECECVSVPLRVCVLPEGCVCVSVCLVGWLICA